MRFVVERKTWLRGKGGNVSGLLTKDGKRCCIGFVCKQLGVPDAAMRDFTVAQDMRLPGRKIANQLLDKNLRDPLWVEAAYATNDDTNISDSEREAELQKLAASAGHELVFVDELAD